MPTTPLPLCKHLRTREIRLVRSHPPSRPARHTFIERYRVECGNRRATEAAWGRHSAVRLEGAILTFSFYSSAEIAEGFRQQGNDLFKARKFRDAIGFYTRALDEVGKDLDIEERRTLWGNRAAANLELSTFAPLFAD